MDPGRFSSCRPRRVDKVGVGLPGKHVGTSLFSMLVEQTSHCWSCALQGTRRQQWTRLSSQKFHLPCWKIFLAINGEPIKFSCTQHLYKRMLTAAPLEPRYLTWRTMNPISWDLHGRYKKLILSCKWSSQIFFHDSSILISKLSKHDMGKIYQFDTFLTE